MSKYEKVRGYYIAGLWDKVRVKNAVEKEWISADEFLFITGEYYEQNSV